MGGAGRSPSPLDSGEAMSSGIAGVQGPVSLRPEGHGSRRWPFTLLAVAVLVAAGIVVYLNSFEGRFVFDDHYNIRNNPDLRSAWPPWRIMFTPSFASRPIVGLTLALNYAADGVNVRGYHTVNLAIHILAALLLFGVIRRTLRTESLRDRFGGAADGLALAAALLWLVHPIQTQSVTYIIQRCTSLAALFYLLMLYTLLRGAGSSRHAWWYGVSVLACLLAMGSKQSAVTAPAVAFLYDRTFLAGSFGQALRRRWVLYAGLVATWLMLTPYFLERAAVSSDVWLPTPWEYARSQFGVVTHYLRLAVFPTGLTLDYQWPVAQTVGEVLPPALFIAALIGLVTWAFLRPVRGLHGRGIRAAGFVGVAFFAILSPTSSFVPIEDLAFEQRMYLALAPVLTLAVVGLYLVAQQFAAWSRVAPRFRRAALTALPAAVVVAAAGVLGWMTLCRNEAYHSGVELWQDTVAKQGDNPRAHNNLGVALYRSDRPEQAIKAFEKAIALSPTFPDPWNNMGVIYMKRGDCDLAIASFSRAIELNRRYVPAYINRGLMYIEKRNYYAAIADFTQALSYSPQCAEAYSNRGYVRQLLGHLDQAIWNYSRAIEIQPDLAQAYNGRGNANLLQDDLGHAIDDYNKAIEIDPSYVPAYNNRAFAFYKLKQFDKAWADLATCRKLGMAVNPEFIQLLSTASGMTEPVLAGTQRAASK